jgi:hypothetical protein
MAPIISAPHRSSTAAFSAIASSAPTVPSGIRLSASAAMAAIVLPLVHQESFSVHAHVPGGGGGIQPVADIVVHVLIIIRLMVELA